MKKVILFSFMLILALSVSAFAARVEISGIVIDAETGDPLIGTNVFVKGTTSGGATDINGRFSFGYDAVGKFTLVIRFMGYKTQERDFSPTDDLSNLKFQMEEDVFLGDAVVVTGIASRTSKSVAEVAVSRVQASELTVTNSYQDVSQMITGKIAGIKVEPATGNVGGGIRFNMRSGGGLNGNEQPLIIVDGVRIDAAEVIANWAGGQGKSMLADLNPEDIEKIEVLKGPAGAASYGTSGSNGVVLITTKRGQMVPGKAKGLSLDYKMVTGYNKQSHKYTEDEFYTYKDANNIFIDGPILQHTLNAYGGTGIMKYFVGLDRRYEHGILPTNYMNRQNVRANVDVFPNDKVVLNVSTSYAQTQNKIPDNDNDIFGYLGNTLLHTQSYVFTDSTAITKIDNINKSNRFIGSMQAQWMPIANLEARFGVGLDESDYRGDLVRPFGYAYSGWRTGQHWIWQRWNSQWTYSADARYTYSPLAGLRITSMVGAQLFDRKNRTTLLGKRGFPSALITNVGAGATYTDGDDAYLHEREAGIFTDHSFSYVDQYFFSFMIRKDFASSIGPKSPSVIYPRASAAVRLDKYNWFPKVFGMMKLRAAYGETGVLPAALDPIPQLWAGGQSGWGVGAILNRLGNDKIEPERIKEIEFGLETEFLKNYSLEFTYYRQTVENSIIDFRNAPSTGKTITAVPFNIGKSKGWGLEALFQGRPLRTKNFQVDFSLASAYQKNEVVDLGGAQPIFDGFDVNVIKEGLPKHEFYTQKVLGAKFDPVTGQYAGVNATTERVALGNPIPPYTGSFSMNVRIFNNFQINVLAEWALGHKIFNNTRLFAIYLMGDNDTEHRKLATLLGIHNYYPELTPYTVGSPEYIDAANRYAKLNFNYDGNFIEDADYFKLREISVSYSFKDLIPTIYGTKFIQDLVLGISGRNLWTTTKYSGADVEVNFDGARSLSRGQDFLTLQSPKVYTMWVRVSL